MSSFVGISPKLIYIAIAVLVLLCVICCIKKLVGFVIFLAVVAIALFVFSRVGHNFLHHVPSRWTSAVEISNFDNEDACSDSEASSSL